ncbi:MAG: cell division protein FtsQ/DivIB [Pseudomonadales bacterium]|nr:cell division protein FtsQ/DivIB [Pseudomonadales bacterium]
MTRFISFFTGLALAVVCGSLLISQYRPQFLQFDELVKTSVFERSSDLSGVEAQLTKAVDLFDATKAKLTESIREWEGIDASQFLSDETSTKPAFIELLAREQDRVYDDISALALAHGLTVSEVKYDENSGWRLTLDSGEQVILGDEEVGTRLHRALSMLDSLPSTKPETRKTVDARYSNGIAIAELDQTVVAME